MAFFTLLILVRVFTRSHGGVWDMFWICCLLLVAFMYIRPWLRRRGQVADCPPKAELGLQILHDSEEANIDIVAVHGLGANPDYAWVWQPKHNPPNRPGYPDKYFNWIKELLPSKLSCRVLAFNYDSTWVSTDSAPQQRLSNISDSLLDSLRNNRDKVSPETALKISGCVDHPTKQAVDRPLIFIGHSFGGNVIEQAIVSASRLDSVNRHIAESTVGVVFLGTPHRGSRAATWAKWIAWLASCGADTEDRLLRALEERSDSLTDRLHNFSCWLFSESVPVLCCFEQLPTDYSSRIGIVGEFVWPLVPSKRFKELVVPETSACIDGHHKISLPTDHLNINKFYGPKDHSFQLIYEQILQMAKSANGRLSRRRKPENIPTSEGSTSGDLRKCLQKMGVRNPKDILSDIQRQKGRRLGHTCEWILKRDEFSIWSASEEPQLLLVIGSPGIGKTIMSTFLVHELTRKVEKSTGKVLAYFFCDDKDHGRKTPTAIMRSFIWQLLLQRHELFQHVQPDFERQTDLLNDFSAVWRIFQRMLQDERAGEVFILIDALDECESSTRENLLVEIKQLFLLSPCGSLGRVKLLITCRPGISDITRQFRALGTWLRIDSAKINNDLSEYINIKVNEITDISGEKYPHNLKEKVRSALKDKAGGTFLWVSLMLAELRGVLMSQVEEKLENLPQGLNDTYATILDRIPSNNRETAQFILRCMVAARRPLRKSEIQTAYATWKTGLVQQGKDLEKYTDILSVCSTILYVESGDNATLNFCHQSVKDFLLHKTLSAKTWYYSTEDEAHLHVFKACWTYLSAKEFNHGGLVVSREAGKAGRLLKTDTSKLQSLFTDHWFLKYSSSKWENHAIGSHQALLRGWCKLAIDVTKAPTLRDAWLLRTAKEGQEDVAKLLLKKGADIEAKDKYGQTPLSLATEEGREAVAKLLLDKGADIEAKDKHGRTPLSLATKEAMTKLLLEKGADIEAKDKYGQTPLSLATEEGREAMAKLLLDKGADIEAKDKHGRTPLSLAAQKGYQDVAKLLLDKGADIEAKDKYGRTPLRVAALSGYKATTKLLLERGADIEAKDEYGRTPLRVAALIGHKAIAKLLLENGAIVNAKDKDVQTPLRVAAFNGHEAVAKLLPENGADVDAKVKDGADVDVKDKDGQTPLLEKGADFNAKDEYSWTPLRLATLKRHETVVKLLLERGADIDAMDKDS
ncbi:hypothetical protein QQS21_011102 [Conoideocrella luteorostrata]|uniref:NACHT domain-containing protein n=1 Tax=Conoideocrella luteorostrata TaxID=1105319 RepID=A0AAJ0CGH3_9HYPO|nr:hypothetical protein QQS21_011102 [Conoideocrella luteorostrata]